MNSSKILIGRDSQIPRRLARQESDAPVHGKLLKKERGKTGVLPSRGFIRGRERYGWTGQRKSAEACLVTVTIPALGAARTAAWDVMRTGVACGFNVAVNGF